MVGFNPSKHQNLSQFDFIVAGCISGSIGRACVQPLDVVKVRFQLQVEPIHTFGTTAKYRSILQAIQCIAKEEGLSAFWKGHLSSQLLAVTYSGVQFTSFEVYTRWCSNLTAYVMGQNESNGKLHPTLNFICGCFAGISSATCTQPLDVLKTRFIAQGEPRTYRNINEAMVCIAKKDGISGFFRGLSPSLLLTAPQTGLQFSIYKLANNIVMFVQSTVFGSPKPASDEPPNIGLIQSVATGGFAGVVSKCFVYPMDVAKKRLQIQGFEEGRRGFGRMQTCKGLRDCFLVMLREEGLAGLFKGLKPSLLKACVSLGCRFGTYEQICKLFVFRKQSIKFPVE